MTIPRNWRTMEPKYQRVHSLIIEALNAVEGLDRSRESALVKTKLDEARLWLSQTPEAQNLLADD